jgi:hypothetical protein
MSTLSAWWIILYYPVIFAVIFGGKRFTDRYPENSPQRNRAEMALGCAFLAMPSAPLILFAVWFVSNAWSDPVLRWIEVYFALLFNLALFYGAMAKFPRVRGIVVKILSPFSGK